MINLKWKPSKPVWSEDCLKLLLEYNTNEIPKQTFENVIEKSSKFPIHFEVDTPRCKFLKTYATKGILERNINSVYPIVHYKALELYCKFIIFKKEYGTEIEKIFYKDMTLKEFIERLLNKRAVSFVGSYDRYMLLSTTIGQGNWESIGTNEEKSPLVLEECLSYDEIKCSAFLNVSSYTFFVNKGDRYNDGKFSEDRSEIEGKGKSVQIAIHI